MKEFAWDFSWFSVKIVKSMRKRVHKDRSRFGRLQSPASESFQKFKNDYDVVFRKSRLIST